MKERDLLCHLLLQHRLCKLHQLKKKFIWPCKSVGRYSQVGNCDFAETVFFFLMVINLFANETVKVILS